MLTIHSETQLGAWAQSVTGTKEETSSNFMYWDHL